jgi:hypothetical protein
MELTIADGRRGLNLAQLGQCRDGEVGEQSPFEHHPSGDILQNGSVLFASHIHRIFLAW